jgi:hypothetical protein
VEETDTRANTQRESHDRNERQRRVSGNIAAVEETETERTEERDENSEAGNVNASAINTPEPSELK